ncbi:hypothetical protein E2320_000642, partial [Naja naja]
MGLIKEKENVISDINAQKEMPQSDSDQPTVCCLIFPISYYKTGYNIVACTICLLLLLISISPFWLMHPEGEYVLSLGFWTKCYENNCYILGETT